MIYIATTQHNIISATHQHNTTWFLHFFCSDYISGDDGYKYKMHTIEQTWDEAEDICRQEGAHLAMEKTQASRDFITKTFNHSFWIGVHDKKAKYKFEFVDGTPVNTTYWAHKQLGYWRRGKDCVFHHGNTHAWDDAPCTDKRPFLCQKRMTHLSKISSFQVL